MCVWGGGGDPLEYERVFLRAMSVFVFVKETEIHRERNMVSYRLPIRRGGGVGGGGGGGGGGGEREREGER